MRRSRIPALILTGLLLGAAAIVGGPRAERGGALLQSYRADILQRVRVARILTDVALGLVEHALDHGVVAPAVSGLLVVVDPRSGVPVYRQLMDQVKFHVASGLLQPGDELPSTRSLSTELGVNPMTVSKAYSYLEREGVVERRPGRPLVVRAQAAEESEARRLDQLRDALAPTATVARQLGIAPARALELFSELLAAEDDPAGDDPTEGQS